jgi:hypothetical protein
VDFVKVERSNGRSDTSTRHTGELRVLVGGSPDVGYQRQMSMLDWEISATEGQKKLCIEAASRHEARHQPIWRNPRTKDLADPDASLLRDHLDRTVK